MKDESEEKDNQDTTDPFISSEIAKGLEQTQIGRYHTKGGHGFAAEDANAFADRVRFKKVEVTGTSHEANGSDRIVDGVPIQTKYFQTASSTIEAAFDAESGIYRYRGQLLEVPKDQYEDCVKLMKEKITQGKVPGITDPSEAERLVKSGEVTYKQARNIAKAGNIESLVFDAKTQAITTSYIFAISFAVHFAKRKWNGESNDNALKGAIESAVAAGGTTLITGIISAQVLRSRAAAIGAVQARSAVRSVSSTAAGKKVIERLAQASLGKAVYGAAAVNHVAKLLRSNVITSTIATVVTSTPDFYRAAFSGCISWPQFTKNLLVNAGGVAAGAGGWMGGAAAGAAMGSAVPVIGTAAGGIIGGIIGALVGGTAGTATTKWVMDGLIEDDAKEMIKLLQSALEDLAADFLLSEKEIAELSGIIKETVVPKWLRSMYQSGSSDNERKAFAYDAFESSCAAIIRKRPKIYLPPIEKIEKEINHMVEAVENVKECVKAEIRVNWNQGRLASDGLLRVHRIENQQSACQFEEMKDFTEYIDLQTAENAIRNKGYHEYKKCAHCWDNSVVSLI